MFHTQAYNEETRLVASKLPKTERQMLIRYLLVKYPVFNEASAFISHFHLPVAGGVHDVGNIGGLLGETRAGKSDICQYYASQFPTVVTDDGDQYPVIYFEATSETTSSSFAETLYLRTGARSVPGKMKVPALITNSIARIARLGVQLVIIDDAQYMFFERTQKEIKNFVSLIKQLADAKAFNILLSGEDRLETLFEHNGVLDGRGGFPAYPLKPLSDSHNDFEKFELLLHSVDLRLPFPKLSGLGKASLAKEFYRYSDGVIGRVMNLVRPAANRALDAGSSNILIEHLYEEAAVRTKRGSGHVYFKGGM
ncbi:ATP-binding protein [Rhizobium tumorigenes]|uniref:ATP-binding protein n=1 Tax=Rhizobium tumorigenes TaxID=2041385 RepID=UPI00241EC833|nr:ATP-binding protein [Rhizobium tumorigenes]WFS02369.1 ATP-binding protein [Rhizobium tumorigenes]